MDMTDETNESTAIAVQEPQFAGLGTRQDVAVMGKRVKALMRGGNKLTDGEAMMVAQYALAIGANPFREIHAFKNPKTGQIEIVDDYKLLVRWARSKCEFNEWYEPISGLASGDIGYTCYILRRDSQDLLNTLIKSGTPLERAMDIACTTAGGVMRSHEKLTVKGWTRDDVAKKRALKNAINKAYGAPSLQDVAAQSWNVDGVKTAMDDWERAGPQASREEIQDTARWAAQGRNAGTTVEAESKTPAQHADDLYGDGAGADMHPEPRTVEEGKYTEVIQTIESELGELEKGFDSGRPHKWTMEEADALHAWAEKKTLSGAQVVEALNVERLSQFTGDLDTAKRCIEAWITSQSE
jgi:hypothetical protein